jgi:hypothetical protein
VITAEPRGCVQALKADGPSWHAPALAGSLLQVDLPHHVITDSVAAGVVPPCSGARALGAPQTIIVTAVDSSSSPAAPVSHVDFERDLLTTAVMVRTPCPR